MKLKERAGQLFILGFMGGRLDENNPIISDLRDRNLGGVILFDKLLDLDRAENNIKSPTQVKLLTEQLTHYAQTPPFISIDQEGGLVRRLKSETGFPETMGPEDMGSANDPLQTAIHASCTAIILKKLGINMNFSPGIDLNINPANPVIGSLGRSFSSDIDRVVRHAELWIREHHKQNVLTCLKHFPGHGSSRTDSHLGLTDISGTWQQVELEPFKILIDHGMADAVMAGHLYNRRLDTTYPASLSKTLLTDILRDELNFKGLCITDDMQMRAITNHYGLVQSACLAIAAGADMVIIGNNLEYKPHILPDLIAGITTGVRNGTISESRINEALQRVEKLKQRLTN